MCSWYNSEHHTVTESFSHTNGQFDAMADVYFTLCENPSLPSMKQKRNFIQIFNLCIPCQQQKYKYSPTNQSRELCVHNIHLPLCV